MLRNCAHDETPHVNCGGESSTEVCSWKDDLSSVGHFTPNKMPARQRRRRITERFISCEMRTHRDSIVSRNDRFRRKNGTGSTIRRNRDESISTIEERRSMFDDKFYHDERVSNSHSSSTSLSSYGIFDWPIIAFILTLLFTVTDACSTRPSPKPRPPRPMWTPDLGFGFVKENCTDDYAELYCYNGGKCFRQKMLETFIVTCECQPGFIGKRCQYRDVPYSQVNQRIETASIAGGVTVLIIVVSAFCLLAWFYVRRRRVFTHLGSSGKSSTGPV